ncbi:MAG: dTMP kinase [Patescibacteria group bacterium]|mgnify:CR=1
MSRKHPGLFIAFEGLDGSGSQQYASSLTRSMSREGYRVTQTSEPTSTMIGGLIRARLAGEWNIAPETLQLLFTADRAEHLRAKILPSLEAGRIVVCDRYILSALAYNVVLVNDPEWLRALNRRFPKPDLTFLIKVHPKVCVRRLKLEQLELNMRAEEQKLQDVWSEYERLTGEFDSIHIIDGERDDVAILDEIMDITQRQLLEPVKLTALTPTA